MEKDALGHLRPETRAWREQLLARYEFAAHEESLLLLACEAWDRCVQAREQLERDGLTYSGRDGSPHAHPCTTIERDSRIAFIRIIRELNLEPATPPADLRRPPALRSSG